MTTSVPLAESTNVPVPSGTPVRVGRVEADMFCDGCLYNLHGLDVLRDERLHLAVVRCPECGKFHAAGHATGAGRVWLDRLARALIALWVLFLFGFTAIIGLAFFILNIVEFEIFLHREYTPRPPYYFTLRPTDPMDFGGLSQYLFARLLVAGIAMFCGWCLGAMLPVFLWHVRKRAWFIFALLLPIGIALCTYQMFLSDVGTRVSPESANYMPMAPLRQAVLQSAGVLAGIYWGRRVTRVVLNVVLTRKLLQYVGFLWEVDGKTPPALRDPEEIVAGGSRRDALPGTGAGRV